MEVINFMDQHIDALTLLVTVIGGFFALYQWRSSVKNGQAEYVDKLLVRFQEDEEIKEFISLNDYENDWYIKEFHEPDSDKCAAAEADKTLFFLDYLCHIRQERIIQRKEFAVFEYNIYAVIQNNNTYAYLADLYQYSLVENRKFPFIHVMDYAIKNNIFPKEIKDEDYYKYVFMLESGMGNVPEIHREIYSALGQSRFLYTYSRCENCKNYDYENKICRLEEDVDSHYWGVSYNRCESFSFDIARWEADRSLTSYHCIKNRH